MKKPSTKKLMNVLKTMVFLKNFMKLGITTIKKFFNSDETYREYREYEIEAYRWNTNHQFEYIIKDSSRWYKLENNEEITKLY